MEDKIISYCECSVYETEEGEYWEPVEFEKIGEEGDDIIARCVKCGRVERWKWWLWEGILPEDIYL